MEKVKKITLIHITTISNHKMEPIEEVNKKITLVVLMGTHTAEQLTYPTPVTTKPLLRLTLSI